MTALAAIVVALTAAAPPACPPPALRPGPLPFSPGETLAFDLEVAGIVQAGTLSLAVEPPMSQGTLLPLRARVRNTSVFAKVHKLKGVALSWVDPQTLRPQRYRDDAEEDGVRKTTDTRLDRPGPVSMAWIQGDKRGTTSWPRGGAEVLDLLSTIYLLRAAQLEPGEAACFDLVANRRFWRATARLAPGTERVETKAGIFDALRVDLTLRNVDAPPTAKPREVHLWFNADATRLLVAAFSDTDAGPVTARLARLSGPRGTAAD